MPIRDLIVSALAALLPVACTYQPPLPEEAGSTALMANVSVGFLGLREPVARRPTAVAPSGTRLILCVRELRFYPRRGETPVVVELVDGEIDVSRGSYEFVAVKVPPGQYEALGLQLSPRCGGASALIQNEFGRFPLRSSRELVWNSGLSVGQRLARIWLPVKALLGGASRVTETAQIPLILDKAFR